VLFIIIFGTLSFPVVSVHGMTRGVVAGFFTKFRTVCNNTHGWNNQIFTCPSFAHLCTSLIRPLPPIGQRSIVMTVSVCLSVREHTCISGTARSIVTNVLVRVAYGRVMPTKSPRNKPFSSDAIDSSVSWKHLPIMHRLYCILRRTVAAVDNTQREEATAAVGTEFLSPYPPQYHTHGRPGRSTVLHQCGSDS